MIIFKKIRLFLIISVLILPMIVSGAGVKIMKVKGDVQLRKGLEENWQPAKRGMMLEDIDTIPLNRKHSPISLISKNWSSLFVPSFDAAIAPIAESSSVSAPLNILRINSEVLNENPIDCMLLCVTSKLKPRAYFLKGRRKNPWVF